MELKVWVDGVARVVCGLSPNTSCHDVVIALAQSIGQTGRYILILKLRGNERQLLADDCPLQHLAKLGQQATEVQFILRRTGDSRAGPPSLGDSRDAPTGKRHLPLPRPSEREPFKHKDSHKAHNISQESSTLPRRTISSRTRTSSRTSPEPRASPVSFLDAPNSVNASPSKEEIFRQILQQRKTLQDLEIQVQALERETEVLEQATSSATVPDLSLDLTEELEKLEQQQRQNKEELILGEQWGELLQAEVDKERDMHKRLSLVQSSVDDHVDQLTEVQANSAHLEQEIQLTVQRRSSVSQQSEEALRLLKHEFHNRQQQAQGLDAALSETQWELNTAEQILQERWEMIQVLNKELRQCDLQQFIQQTGGLYTDQTNSPPLTEAHLSRTGATE